MTPPKLRDHPRLLVSHQRFERLANLPHIPPVQAALKTVDATAPDYINSTQFDYPRNHHNAHLIRARTMQCRIVTLIVQWYRTGNDDYRKAAIEHVREMGRWEYWSWIAWRKGDACPNAIFDLSCGENSATLALAYDWLFDAVSPDERDMFVEIATKRAINPFLANTQPDNRMWWYGKPDSNWNSVCAGGAGMLALAMHEELGDADTVLQRAEESLAPFMHELDVTQGGWPEGIGYWNYGMLYAFQYLLSRERAEGTHHTLLQSPAVAQTLSFPLDFCPNGSPCSFGDVNNWTPLAFHYAAAHRLDRPDVLTALAAQFQATESVPNARGNAAMLLLLHPDGATAAPTEQCSVHKLYPVIDWGILADRMPNPNVYISVRGGSTRVPHSHLDLLSFNCVVGNEKLICNIGPAGYLDSTFSGRRWELFEMSPQSKNTLLINGVGITPGSAVVTRCVNFNNARGVHMDAASAMGAGRDTEAAMRCERYVLMLQSNRAALVVDRVRLPHAGLIEQRFHSMAEIAIENLTARFRGTNQELHAACACDQPTVLLRAGTALTHPIPGPDVLRFCLRDCCRNAVMATVLVPGKTPVQASLQTDTGVTHLQIRHPDWQETVAIPVTDTE